MGWRIVNNNLTQKILLSLNSRASEIWIKLLKLGIKALFNSQKFFWVFVSYIHNQTLKVVFLLKVATGQRSQKLDYCCRESKD